MSDENVAQARSTSISGSLPYTMEMAAKVKAAVLSVICNDANNRASTAYIARTLFSLDERLAVDAGILTKQGIKDSPGMSPKQEHAFRLNILKNAINSIDPQKYPKELPQHNLS